MAVPEGNKNVSFNESSDVEDYADVWLPGFFANPLFEVV
jgi:hypothetical protein